jgi:predicted enzyme related to lactoylglutathione lyase
MLNLNSLLLFSEAPKILVDFYKKVLAQDATTMEGDYNMFQVGASTLVIGPHAAVHGKNKNPERIMFNLETADVKTEFGRIKAAGAKVITEPYSMGENKDFLIATLADPDGNYFQLISPMK